LGLPENFAAVARAAQALGVDPDLARAVAWAESRGHHYDDTGQVIASPTGALGIMQLLPRTAQGLGVDARDVWENVRGGVEYLRRIAQRLGVDRLSDDSVRAIAAAYNRGPAWDQAQPWPEALRRYTSQVVAAWRSAPWPMPTPRVAVDVTGPRLVDEPQRVTPAPPIVRASPGARWPAWVWLPVAGLALLVATAGRRRGRR
jgi:hypothetical protein